MLKVFDGHQDAANLQEIAKHLDGMERAMTGVLNEYPFIAPLAPPEHGGNAVFEEHLNKILAPFMVNVRGSIEVVDDKDVAVTFCFLRNPEETASMICEEYLLHMCVMRRPYRTDVPDSNAIFAKAFREMVGKFLIKASKIMPILKQSAPPRPTMTGPVPPCPNS